MRAAGLLGLGWLAAGAAARATEAVPPAAASSQFPAATTAIGAIGAIGSSPSAQALGTCPLPAEDGPAAELSPWAAADAGVERAEPDVPTVPSVPAARAAGALPSPVTAPPPLALRPEPVPPLGFDRALGVPRTPFGKLIYSTASRHALNPRLVAALVGVESGFNPRAVSRRGACGLMQVRPATARRFGVRRRKDLFNPRKNLETGSRYLRWLVDRYGEDPLRVLAAYNAGEGAVERFGGLPPFAETRGYVQRIYARLGFVLAAELTQPAAVAAAAPAPPSSSTR